MNWKGFLIPNIVENNTALQKNILKYTIDEYHHFLCIFGRWIRIWHKFFSYTSRFGCVRSRTFCISIENWKKNWAKVDKESEKSIRVNLSCLFFDIFGFSIFKQKLLWSKLKFAKIWKLKFLTENELFQLHLHRTTH